MIKLELLHRIASYLKCPSCGGREGDELLISAERILCPRCHSIYPILNGVPSFVQCEQQLSEVEKKTNTYFGFEWAHFDRWGFIEDDEVVGKNQEDFLGGLVSHRKAAFDSKCRITNEELQEGCLVLDAGCGNGRYTFEAASRGKAIIIGVDIGQGSSQAAAKNVAGLENVLIIQASLFRLPFRDGVFTSAFSNGVLMHTGNAQAAFQEVARTVAEQGTFVVHVYHRLNPVWEAVDYFMRAVTTRLSVEMNMRFAARMSSLAKWMGKKPGRLERINKIMRLQKTPVHMYDWYSAPIATHHTYPELAAWFKESAFMLLDTLPRERPVFHRPWAVNIKGKKREKGAINQMNS